MGRPLKDNDLENNLLLDFRNEEDRLRPVLLFPLSASFSDVAAFLADAALVSLPSELSALVLGDDEALGL